MKIERSDIQFIARGRVGQETIKKTQKIVLIAGGLVMVGLFINMPMFVRYALIAVGMGALMWDSWEVGKKRKKAVRELLNEWTNERGK